MSEYYPEWGDMDPSSATSSEITGKYADPPKGTPPSNWLILLLLVIIATYWLI